MGYVSLPEGNGAGFLPTTVPLQTLQFLLPKDCSTRGTKTVLPRLLPMLVPARCPRIGE